MYGYSKMGYGPKKTECQDSYCIMERFIEDCHFFAGNLVVLYFSVYDGPLLVLIQVGYH